MLNRRDNRLTKLSWAATLVLLLTMACTEAPAAVALDSDPELVEVLAEMIAAGELSQTRAQIILAALRLRPNEVLEVRDVGDEPEHMIRSLGVVEGDPPVELYLTARTGGS